MEGNSHHGNFSFLKNEKYGMKFKSTEISGAHLILAVAQIEGDNIRWDKDEEKFFFYNLEEGGYREYDPTNIFDQAGPIRVREKMWIKYPFGASGEVEAINGHLGFPNFINAFGPDELVASMRCLVRTKCGEEIEIDEEVLKTCGLL